MKIDLDIILEQYRTRIRQSNIIQFSNRKTINTGF